MKKDRNLIDFLRDYARKKTVRFHMPGHKGKSEYMKDFKDIASMDITEIDGADNLHNAEGIIWESQKRASKLFGAEETLFLVNGTTSGIYTAIMGSLKPGDKALVQRNSHRAVYNAMILGDIDPRYIYPVYNSKAYVDDQINLDQLNSLLKKERVKAVFVTSPSYYGVVQDIESIAQIVHKNNAILIVDEAHGSHLPFIEELPKSAIESGADIVVQSTHKTLLGLTQSAMLHICTNRVDKERVRSMAKIHQTSSPSYLLMGSLDNTVSYIQNMEEGYIQTYIGLIKKIRAEISAIEGISLLGRKDLKSDYDITRLAISVENMSGKQLEDKLRLRGIEMEMSDERYAIAISTIADKKSDLMYLKDSLQDIVTKESQIREWVKEGYSRTIDRGKSYSRELVADKMPKGSKGLIGLREAYYMEARKTNLEDSVGRISADFIVPYPPGIPILAPGEEITREIIDYIMWIRESELRVIGLEEGHIKTLEMD